jgi:hypothetical protein
MGGWDQVMLGKLQLYGLIALAFIAGVFGIYMGGVQRGIDRTKRKIDEKRLSHMKTAKEVDDEITSADDQRLADIASEWVRKDNE